MAYGSLQLFRLYAPVDLPRLAEVRLNTSVLGFSAAVTLCASLLFSILPGLHLLRAEPQAALQQGLNLAKAEISAAEAYRLPLRART